MEAVTARVLEALPSMSSRDIAELIDEIVDLRDSVYDDRQERLQSEFAAWLKQQPEADRYPEIQNAIRVHLSLGTDNGDCFEVFDETSEWDCVHTGFSPTAP